jgi:hypothetical protein
MMQPLTPDMTLSVFRLPISKRETIDFMSSTLVLAMLVTVQLIRYMVNLPQET